MASCDVRAPRLILPRGPPRHLAVERVTGKVVAEGGELQDEEQFLRERQEQLERDLNELKRRQEAVRLEKLERQLQVL